MHKYLLVSLSAVFFCLPANAAPPGQNYFGVQYALTTVDIDIDVSGLDEFKPTALTGRLGHYLSENVAVEGRIAIGAEDDSQDVDGVDVDFEIEELFGIYGVFQTSGNGGTEFYGIVGYSEVEGKISAPGDSESDDESGLSYGFGLNNGGFIAEYMIYLDEDDVEVSAISLGYVGHF